MPSLMTLSGSGLGATSTKKKCKCVHNKRTGRSVQLCFVGKSKKHRSGWAFTGKCR